MEPMNFPSPRVKTSAKKLVDLFKGIWRVRSLWSVLFAASFALFVFTRWLDFFIVSTRSKVVIFGALFVFFFFFSIFFFSPILNYLAGKKKVLFSYLGLGILFAAALTAFLPTHQYEASAGQLILTVLNVNNGLVLFCAIFLALGAIHCILKGKDCSYQIFMKDAQRYVLDYLILSGVLLGVAIGVRFLKPDSPIKTLFILLPGLLFLVLKVVYTVMPSLPIVIMGLTLSVNLLVNFGLFPTSLLPVTWITERTFNELAIWVNPGDPTLMSIGFYKQLRNSDLVLETGSVLASEKNITRLKQINLLDKVYILDYPGEISSEEAQRLLGEVGWEKWDRREFGSFYFYRADDLVTSPIVIFTSQDDFFLVPSDFLDGLDLYDDFIFD